MFCLPPLQSFPRHVAPSRTLINLCVIHFHVGNGVGGMRIGDIDGRGIIYDSEGRLLLENDESLVRVYRGFYAHVGRGWSWLGGKIMFDSHEGAGTLYVTNRRLVLIRLPNPHEILKAHGRSLGILPAAADAMRAKALRKGGVMQYCEIRYENISSYKHVRWGIRLFLISEGKKYLTGADKIVARWVLPFLVERNIRQR